VWKSGEAFFYCKSSKKMLSRLRNNTGYRPYGVEYSQSAAYPDSIESFSVSRGFRYDNLEALPVEARLLYDDMLALFPLFEAIAEQLAASLIENLTNSAHKQDFVSGFRDFSLLQLNYSRPGKIENELINEVHEDGSLVTIASATAPGLQLLASNGVFLPVTLKRDELLLMAGEILYLLSGGKIRPAYHRVIPAPGVKERMSLLFFADLNPSLCKPWILTESNKGIDIGERVRKNPLRFGLPEWKFD
jgi:isopenicillin N synthase-like dioxygenase